MFYPYPSGSVGSFFNTSTGRGIANTGWDKWAICDGRNSTPDLRGRFIVGQSDANSALGNSEANQAAYLSPGNTGGVRVQLILDTQLPPHKHEFNYERVQYGVNALGSPAIPFLLTNVNNGGIPGYNNGNGDTNDGPTDTTGGTFQSAQENRPPYFTLLYVIKIS